ncbi:hypothetical protein Tco_0311036, partial [Tanacetum coccineum]
AFVPDDQREEDSPQYSVEEISYTEGLEHVTKTIAPFISNVGHPLMEHTKSSTPTRQTSEPSQTYRREMGRSPTSFVNSQPKSFANSLPPSFAYSLPTSFANTQPRSFANSQPTSFANSLPTSFATSQPSSHAEQQEDPQEYVGMSLVGKNFRRFYPN